MILAKPPLMVLKDATESLTIVLAGAKTTIDATYRVVQVDGVGSPVEAVNTTNGVTAVVPMIGVTGDPPKVLDSLFICNSDTGSITVTVNKKIGSTSYPIAKAIVVPVGATMVITGDLPGARVYTSVGALTATSSRLAVQAVTAAGSLISDAAALIEGMNVVTGADGTKGVILPVAAPGMIVYLKGVTNAVLKVWPQTGAQINAVAASSAYSMASGVLPQEFIASSSAQWYSLPLVAS